MENIIQSNISKEMKKRYIEYAMDVIEGRALPDGRDGLKPIHRRILWSMHELGLTNDKGFKKCARVVGEVLGKWHPHGDSSAYGALVNMVQWFYMRYPLIEGHGNFGSIDGDGAAAMRYTECKLKKLSEELVRDIYKDTVDFIDNFDGEEKEPIVLPSRYPNLLVNGAFGIAVGMATDIPTHNLKEVIDSICYRLYNQNCSTKEIMDYIKSPDYCTGATIINPDELLSMYENGKGKVIVRSKYKIREKINKKKNKIKEIVITEIPSRVNKAKLCQSIVELSLNDKQLKDIIDIRDESNLNGISIIIEIKDTCDENKIISYLFKKTELQKNFSYTFRVLVNGEPQILSLLGLIDLYIQHQQEVLTRRSQYMLNKHNKRLHILNGILIAIDKMDYTIRLIRESKSTQEAKEKLINNLSIDEEQSKAILDMKLQRLTNLESENIDKEHKQLQEEIKNLNNIINDKDALNNLLKKELIDIHDKYGDERRTTIMYEDNLQEITNEDLIEDMNVTMVLTNEGYIKRTKKYSEQQNVKEGDYVIQYLQCNNKENLLLFTDKGNVFIRKVYNFDEKTPSAFGQYLMVYLKDYLLPDEKIIKIASTSDWKGYTFVLYKNGNMSKVNLESFKPANNRMKSMTAYNTDNPLLDISVVTDDVDILMISDIGKAIIVNSKTVNSVGSRTSKGNTIIKLKEDSVAINGVIGITKENWIYLTDEKEKETQLLLDDVCKTSPDKSLFNYLYRERRGAEGNHLRQNHKYKLIKADVK